MSGSRPLFLITNDDGLDSFFLGALVEACLRRARVVVAAPAAEQSWIAKAVSRLDRPRVEAVRGRFACPAWKIAGTPADCVNIALGHLLDERPHAVLSGINIGYNTSLPLILSSGTVGGALEAALHGLPAAAFSLALPADEFSRIKLAGREAGPELSGTLDHAARHAAQYALELASPSPGRCIVHNVNYPFTMDSRTRMERTRPARSRTRSLFRDTGKGEFAFQFAAPREELTDTLSDTQCLTSGRISASILDFSRLGDTFET